MVRHLNFTEEAENGAGKVYCHAKADVVPFDGEFVSKSCWGCSLWAGLLGGYGVECLYDDDMLGKNVTEMKYRSAEDAKERAPELKDVEKVADEDGKKAKDFRQKISADTKKAVDTIQSEKPTPEESLASLEALNEPTPTEEPPIEETPEPEAVPESLKSRPHRISSLYR